MRTSNITKWRKLHNTIESVKYEWPVTATLHYKLSLQGGGKLSLLFVGSRIHFTNVSGIFDTAENMISVEVLNQSDHKIPSEVLTDPEAFTVDHNTTIDDFMKGLTYLPIDWDKTITDWITGDTLVSVYLEHVLTIFEGKKLRAKLESLIEKYKKPPFKPNTVLFTKDGRKIGNAIIVRIDGDYTIIKTDYGNECKLNNNEINEFFYIKEHSIK